jgi:hypothetical protein
MVRQQEKLGPPSRLAAAPRPELPSMRRFLPQCGLFLAAHVVLIAAVLVLS